MNRYQAVGTIGSGLLAAALPRPAHAATTLRVATIPIDGTALPYYAKDLNYFQDAGIDIALQSITSGGAITSAVISNSVDIGSTEITSLSAAYKHGLPVVVIAAAGIHTTGSLATQLMVKKDSPLHTASDLNGKTIGVTGLVNIAQFAPMLWMDKNGGKSSSLKFVEIPMPELPAALQQGRIDAAWLAEPFVHNSAAFTRTFATCFDAVGTGWVLGAFFTSRAWAAANRPLVEAFRNSITKAAVWANANPDKSAAVLAKYSNRDADAVRATYRTTYATQVTAASLQPVIDLAARYGAISSSFPAQEIMYS